MNDLTLILIAILGLFTLLLLAKQMSRTKFCVICVSVSLTWLTLLVLTHLERFENPTLLALLMGQSITGLYYLFEKRVEEKYHLFRLPLLLSLLVIFYTSITAQLIEGSLLLIGGLWGLFGTLFLYRENPRLKHAVETLIACCRDW